MKSFFFAMTGLLLLTSTAEARLYKWIDENGNVFYSDQIPPEASREQHQVLDNHGVIRQNVRAAKTPEEIAEEQRQAAVQAEQDKIARAQAQRDRLLLDTFSTERDLLLARDDRVASMQSSIDLTAKLLEQLREKLQRVDGEYQELKAAGRAIPENLEVERVRLQEDILQQDNSLAARENEKENLINQFANDLVRYRELKAMRE